MVDLEVTGMTPGQRNLPVGHGSFLVTLFSSSQSSSSLCQFFARAAKICGHVCILCQAISYRKNFFTIVNMKSWLELQVRKHGRINIDEPHFRVFGHQVTPAFRAEISVTPSRFMELSNMFGTLCYLRDASVPVCQRVKPLTGDAGHDLQDWQWQ